MNMEKQRKKLLDSIEKILIGYDEFLSNISDKEVRNSLKEVEFKERNENKHYMNLKQKAKEFHNHIITFLKTLNDGLVRKFLIF